MRTLLLLDISVDLLVMNTVELYNGVPGRRQPEAVTHVWNSEEARRSAAQCMFNCDSYALQRWQLSDIIASEELKQRLTRQAMCSYM
jgi:hypothetical protein